MRGDTNKFVHKAENDAQKNRRERKNILKKEFRESAAKSAAKFFGKNSPQVDIIEKKTNCTQEIVRDLAELSLPSSFNSVLENFLNTVKIEGGELRKGSAITTMISLCDPELKEDITTAAVELLMATEDEMLVHDFVGMIAKSDTGRAMTVLEGMNKLAKIEYIHTLKACAEGFVKNPEDAEDMLEKIGSRIGVRTSTPDAMKDDVLFSDMVLLEVVKERFGL